MDPAPPGTLRPRPASPVAAPRAGPSSRWRCDGHIPGPVHSRCIARRGGRPLSARRRPAAVRPRRCIRGTSP
ncbi:hypothetical protein ACFFX0_16785 [Citricoccus parietis]|uniref:Uncharacterized protein n=1 Tax=Citricoccus parietis TaxID=592307 RepID=A0ABV5G1F9_9MICC